MPHPQLSGDPEFEQQKSEEVRLRREISGLERELQEAREEAQEAKQASADAIRAIRELRRQLEPMFKALKMVFGEISRVDADEQIAAGSTNGTQSKSDSIWQQRKNKIGGRAGDAIQAFLDLDKALTRDQIRIALGCGWTTVDAAIKKLSDMGLIERSGREWRLKQL